MSKLRGLSRSSFSNYRSSRPSPCKVIFGKPINYKKRKKEVEFIKNIEESKKPPKIHGPIIFYGNNTK